MPSYLKVSVISILLFQILLCHSQTRDLDGLNDCDDAFRKAESDVKNGQLLWYKQIRPNAHSKYFIQDPTSYYKRRNQIDSLMYIIHGIDVKRYDYLNDTLLNRDRIARCYNVFITHHMDTTYSEHFMIEIYNELNKLHGEPPLDSTWVRKKKIPDQK